MCNSPDAIRDRIERWRLPAEFTPAFKCVELILRAMEAPAFLAIQDPRLQVVAVAESITWAYFPIYERRWIARQLPYPVESGVKVLLVIGEDTIQNQPRRTTMAELAHHFGHVLCYLRKPGWIHSCSDADRAATKSGLSRFVRTPEEIYGRVQ